MPTPKRRAAKRPATRKVAIVLGGEFEGWEATCRVDFPLSVLADLDASDLRRAATALDAIVIDHNFPNEKDEIAASMVDVDPFEAVGKLAEKLSQEISNLPPR